MTVIHLPQPWRLVAFKLLPCSRLQVFASFFECHVVDTQKMLHPPVFSHRPATIVQLACVINVPCPADIGLKFLRGPVDRLGQGAGHKRLAVSPQMAVLADWHNIDQPYDTCCIIDLENFMAIMPLKVGWRPAVEAVRTVSFADGRLEDFLPLDALLVFDARA